MDILNLMQCTDLGGTERASLQLMSGLQQRHHACRVISLNPLGHMAPLLRQQGIPAEGLPYRGIGGVLSAPGLRSRLKQESCDAFIMTGHNLLAMTALGELGNGRRLLAVHHHHTGEKPAWHWRLIYRLAEKTFQAITFPSDFIRREAEALYPPLASKSHTIRNPIEVPVLPTLEQREAARDALGIAPETTVIGNAGWLIPRKRFDVFLRVAAQVAKQEKETMCIIAGDGPERSQLERLAHELGMAERVRWLGWQADMTPFYLSLDCLLFNSDWEALSMTALEALSYAVPLVASVEHGGLGEIVKNEQHGVLLGSHDIEKLSDAVLRSLGKDGARFAMAGRARVEQCCEFNACVSAVERLIAAR
jgi:glycosyltransferase involved in cell wall biosynthesis